MESSPSGLIETGVPAFVVLGPEALGLSAAPTDLHLLPDGRMLVVSKNEIAFGDGVRWEVFRAADGEKPIISQVAVAANGEIYTAVEGAIARVEMDTSARWHLRKAVDLPRPDFGRSTMISVMETAGQWFWYGGSGLVRWQPGQPPRGTLNVPAFDRIFSVGEKIFLRDAGDGNVFQLEPDGTSHPVTRLTVSTEAISSGVPFSASQALVGTATLGLMLFDGVEFTPFPTNGWAAGHRITDLCDLGGDNFAAAVDGIGMVFFDRTGRSLQVLDRTVDHRLGRVRRLVPGRDGVVWALLKEGVVRVQFPSPVSYFEPLLASGLTFAKAVRHAGKLWVQGDGQTLRGIYTPAGRLERFESDSPPGSYVFTLAEFNGELFAANELGIYAYEGGEWKLAAAGIVNGRLAPATRRGWPYFARGEWGFLRRTPEGFSVERFPLPQLGDNYNCVAEDSGVLWYELGTGRAGRFDPNAETPTVRLFDNKDGLVPGWVEIYAIEGIARLHLNNQLFRYDEALGKFVADRELISRYPMLANAGGRPIIDPLGRLWCTIAGSARLYERNGAGVYVEQPLPMKSGPFEYTVQEDGVLWYTANFGMSRVDLRVASPTPRPLEVAITSVQQVASNRRIFQPSHSLGSLPYADNSIVFHFAAPANPFAPPVTFQVLLEGIGTSWVSTGSVGSASFNRLKEGIYKFRVRAITGTDVAGTEAHLAFEILPPWYRTAWAWTAYVVLTFGLFAFAAWFSAFLQRRENERLERLVTERTEELNRTNVQLSRQIVETTEKSTALSSSEERYRTLNTELEARVRQRTSELSLTNAELQHRESLFRLIFEHAAVGISWKRADLGGNYHLNATFRRILALNGNFTDTSPLTTLIHPEDAARQAALNQEVQSGRSDSYNVEARFALPDGRIVWGSLSVAVVRDEHGRIVQDIGILEDITARKQAEEELAKTYKNLVDASRLAGMAEVATGVLHNVGNVLNSLNVSSNLVTETVHRSKVDGLVKLAALVNEHAGDLGEFLTHDPKGKLVPGYIASLAEHSAKERETLLQEVASMQKNIDHIKEIVATQQGHATAAGVIETLEATELFEDAVRMNGTDLAPGLLRIVREFGPVPPLSVEKGKVVQILVNLIRNAKHACDDVQKLAPREPVITLGIAAHGADRVRLVVRDNGIGIPAENLTRIFVHGFTTRAYGHGFGLHSSAIAAKEMKGSLTVVSEGPQRGATFTLELPIAAERSGGEFPRKNRQTPVFV